MIGGAILEVILQLSKLPVRVSLWDSAGSLLSEIQTSSACSLTYFDCIVVTVSPVTDTADLSSRM